MGLFTRRDKSPPITRKAVIREVGGTFHLDPEYAKLGESEGWLTYVGYYRLNGEWYSVFRHNE